MKKLGESFKGILGGIVFIIIGIGLLWWNEGNNVKNIKTTDEMEKLVIDVKSDTVDAANEGKLIATYGKLLNEQTMNDEDFKVSVKTPKLVRTVEMYQWQENEQTDDDNNTTYTYEKVWSETVIDSSNFHQAGHENPTMMPYSSKEFLSNSVQVGAFDLNSDQISSLSTKATFTGLSEEVAQDINYKMVNNYYINSEDYNNPVVGDIRISFVYNDSTDISILAVQTGKTFTEFVSKVGKKESRLMDGIHSGKEMIEVIKQENKLIKWLLRLGGAILIMLGFSTILKPISVIGGVIPLLGSIVEGAVGIISFILGLCVSLVVIAVAWIRFRPILGIGLLAAVIVLLVLVKTKFKKKPTNEEQPQVTEDNNQNM